MRRTVFIILFLVVATHAWSMPFYPVQRAPTRFTRYAPLPPRHRIPIQVVSRSRPQKTQQIPVGESESDQEHQRPKRGHDDYNFDSDHERDHDHHGTRGVTGPVHTFVKTDKNANYKWGVRHHVGNKYAS